MKCTFIAGIAGIGLILLTPKACLAQGTMFFSNLAEPTANSVSIGADSWLAQFFLTGGNPAGYRLDSIQLLMSEPVGDPAGFSISIYGGTNPGLGPENMVASLTGNEPASAGIFTYVGTEVLLAPRGEYWVVATSTTPAEEGSYSWNVAGSSGSVGSWRSAGFYNSSTDGSAWTVPGDHWLQFAINATPIPEPSILALLGLAGLCLVSRAMKERVTSVSVRTP